MSTVRPGSLAEYTVPGMDTLDGLPVPLPLIESCAHEMYLLYMVSDPIIWECEIIDHTIEELRRHEDRFVQYGRDIHQKVYLKGLSLSTGSGLV